jgi:F-type H+-transporting ATPase subunit delta
LTERFGRRVKASVVVEPELIGGVSIRMGDEVIDASVRGKLSQLSSALKA